MNDLQVHSMKDGAYSGANLQPGESGAVWEKDQVLPRPVFEIGKHAKAGAHEGSQPPRLGIF